VTPGRGKNTAAPQRPDFEEEKRVMPGKPAADRYINLYIDVTTSTFPSAAAEENEFLG
jgi:hypothetical protein